MDAYNNREKFTAWHKLRDSAARLLDRCCNAIINAICDYKYDIWLLWKSETKGNLKLNFCSVGTLQVETLHMEHGRGSGKVPSTSCTFITAMPGSDIGCATARQHRSQPSLPTRTQR
eukprot:3398676-Rhodomonas_salina.3